jgi:YbbR domain-containing protein
MLRRWRRSRWRRSRWRWRRVASNLFLAATSVILALVIWFLVTESQLATVEERLGFGLAVEVVNTPNGLAPANRLPTASINIAGSESDVQAVIADDFVATVDLAGLQAGAHDVPVRVRSLADGVRVRSVTPESVEVILEPVEQRTLQVTVLPVNPPPLGFEVGEPVLSSRSVTVSGIRQLVDLVDVVVAAVDLGGTTVAIDVTTILQARTATGAAVSGVQIDPATVEVRIPVEQVTFRRSVAIEPLLTGRPRTGFRVAGVNVEPLSVVVVGTLEALENVETVATESISVAARETDFSAEAELVPPVGLALETTSTVTVQVTIEPIHTEATFLLAVEVVGLGEGLTADVRPQLVTVTLEGPSSTIAEIVERMPSAIVDLMDLTPGLHPLALELDVTLGAIVTLLPKEVTVVIAEEGQEAEE